MMQTILKKAMLLFFYSLSFDMTFGQNSDLLKQLKGLDQYVEKTLKEWNTPGLGIGIVVKNKLVFSKGYGYRDYGKKLPVTANTLYQIASNTKLFTATAVGMLVDEGKLDWDKPIRNYVPSIQFYNDELNNSVTIHDMLSHRTGITRHDLIWYKSDFNRKELFEKLKYLEPAQPLRQGFRYNNLMYGASGYIIELLSQKTWEQFIQEKILNALSMKNTVFSIADMKKQNDYFVPYNEKRDSTLLYQIPWYEETIGLGPAGSIISNIEDLSHWLIALMNNGKYSGGQAIPSFAVKATLEPSVPLPDYSGMKGYKEAVNPLYGMGRGTVSYRGHLVASHGGDLPGIHSQISYMPQDSIGVIVFVIGNQAAPLYDVISYNIYERMLGLDLTPWSERELKDQKESKKMNTEGRRKASVGQVTGTKPSHALDDYTGRYEHAAYGDINITKKDSGLYFALHKIGMPLMHFHYDRFDTPNDEENGIFSANFNTNSRGDIDRLIISLDESEVTFVRRPDSSLSEPSTLALYTGSYEIAGYVLEVMIKNKNQLFVVETGQVMHQLIPYKSRLFHDKDIPDLSVEFILENGKVTGMKTKDPSGEYAFKKK